MHQPQAKRITLNKGYSTLALPFALTVTETRYLAGMGKNVPGQSIK
jgi:hypothetical protein